MDDETTQPRNVGRFWLRARAFQHHACLLAVFFLDSHDTFHLSH